ncbi:large conductance mechanosensitive channel protein MscL [Candidatus Phytoplasma pruni]|uniref:Large conductance mechanosensitive channel protein MscL n=1 Tax=Candidatus Phytoplasma pruni TaxID=479893 RepID=A0A851HBL8_9MOLU|nr:large conductance mechanosensitive channel protein MscL [Candidatus Phytoplasma pruni]NWN45475.1 large conductance mechanosensitive channel protein MscL [Candidatus Phytoplasma pruni]
MSENKYLHQLKDFKDGFKSFINKGDVIKLAIAIVMGQLFTKMVSSLSTDVIMPPIVWLFNGKFTLNELKIRLGDGENAINYGKFLQNVFEFFMVAFIIYIFVYHGKKHLQTKTPSNIKDLKNDEIKQLEQEKVALLKEIKDLLQNPPK